MQGTSLLSSDQKVQFLVILIPPLLFTPVSVVIFTALVACAAALPVDRAIIPNGGRPGCKTEVEMNTRIWRNTDDPQRY